MSLLSSLACRRVGSGNFKPPIGGSLFGPRVVLRIGETADWKSWRFVRDDSRDFLVPWEPAWPVHALTCEHFTSQLRRHWKEWRDGKGYSFQICLSDGMSGFEETFGSASYKHNLPRSVLLKIRTLPVIGGISLTDIERGIGQKGTLGYWIGRAYARQGLMKEAAELVCFFAFDVLGLHRIEASCLPGNEPSKRLLSSLGFVQEGLAKEYLKINGQWQDHMLWGRINETSR